MTTPRTSWLNGTVILVLVITLPLFGAFVAGRDLRPVRQFPPILAIPTDYRKFSWVAAGAVLALVLALAAVWIRRRRQGRERNDDDNTPGIAFVPARNGTVARFPGWGWLAVLWTAAWWVLAWNRWSWFEALQRFTFFPLWLGFIVTVNALTQRRSGTCLLRRAPARWLALFAASASLWWVFEWLNRFVQNWHYLGVEDFGPVTYALHASLCFSTVLPAVAAVAEWLDAREAWRRQAVIGPVWAGLARPGWAALLLAGAVIALVLTGARPRWFYPALWVAPLLAWLALQVLTNRRGVAHELARGDWSRAATWMLAALVCGFFWELWNWHSAAKWIYTVPGVERWHLFEMPLLGYTGYLPFGLECLCAAKWVLGPDCPSSHPAVGDGAG